MSTLLIAALLLLANPLLANPLVLTEDGEVVRSFVHDTAADRPDLRALARGRATPVTGRPLSSVTG